MNVIIEKYIEVIPNGGIKIFLQLKKFFIVTHLYSRRLFASDGSNITILIFLPWVWDSNSCSTPYEGGIIIH